MALRSERRLRGVGNLRKAGFANIPEERGAEGGIVSRSEIRNP